MRLSGSSRPPEMQQNRMDGFRKEPKQLASLKGLASSWGKTCGYDVTATGMDMEHRVL